MKAVMSLYKGSKTKVKVGSEFSQEFYVAVGVHQGSLLFRECLIKEALYADELVLMSKMMEGLNEMGMEKCIGE